MIDPIVEAEIERLDNVIRASEDWAKGYHKDPENLARLIRVETALEKALRRFYVELAEKAIYMVDWPKYGELVRQLQAADNFTVDVVVNEIVDNTDGLLIEILFEPITKATALGAQSGEVLYQLRLGLDTVSDPIQMAAKQQVAELVGKKVTKDGVIINNPKAKYRLSDQLRKEISQSINTSISLSETPEQAVSRLSTTIKNPKRAQKIAQTETVNAFQNGIHTFGSLSGAAGKEWQSVGAIDICAEFEKQGIVPILHEYLLPSGRQIKGPTAHPYCRCNLRLVYSEEMRNV